MAALEASATSRESFDLALWHIFIITNTKANPHDPEVMTKRSFLELLRNSGVVQKQRREEGEGKKLMEAEVNVIHQQEMARTKRRRFNFSAFRRAIQVVAKKLYKQLAPTEAQSKLMDNYVLPKTKRIRSDFEAVKNIGVDGNDVDSVVTFLAAFGDALTFIFSYFGLNPAIDELSLGRHEPRDDIPQSCQSMPLPQFVDFASCFNLHPGIADQRHQTETTLTHSNLATIFFASIAVECVDSVGGLTFEEFNEALVRAAMILKNYQFWGDVAAEDKLLACFQHMANQLPKTVPRFVNNGQVRVHEGKRGSKATLSTGGRGSKDAASANRAHFLMKGSKLFTNVVHKMQIQRQKEADRLLADRQKQHQEQLLNAAHNTQISRAPTLALAANHYRLLKVQKNKVASPISPRSSTIAGGSILLDVHAEQQESLAFVNSDGSADLFRGFIGSQEADTSILDGSTDTSLSYEGGPSKHSPQFVSLPATEREGPIDVTHWHERVSNHHRRHQNLES